MSAAVDYFPNIDTVFQQTRRMSIPYIQQTSNQISNISMPRRYSVQTDGSHYMSQQNHSSYQIAPQQQQRFQCIQKPPLRNVLSAPVAPLPTIQRKDSLKTSETSGSTAELARYKTELCRPFEETGQCRYGAKCQFAHGFQELRSLNRHPKYKTELCRTFHTTGFCSYGQRCNFIHNDEERILSTTSTSSMSKVHPFEYPLTINSTGNSPASSIDGGSSPSLSPHYLNDDVFSSATGMSPTPSFGSDNSLTNSFSPPGSPKHDQYVDSSLLPSPLDLGLELPFFGLKL